MEIAIKECGKGLATVPNAGKDLLIHLSVLLFPFI